MPDIDDRQDEFTTPQNRTPSPQSLLRSGRQRASPSQNLTPIRRQIEFYKNKKKS